MVHDVQVLEKLHMVQVVQIEDNLALVVQSVQIGEELSLIMCR